MTELILKKGYEVGKNNHYLYCEATCPDCGATKWTQCDSNGKLRKLTPYCAMCSKNRNQIHLEQIPNKRAKGY